MQEALKLSGAVFHCLGAQLLLKQDEDAQPQQTQQQHLQQQHTAGLLTWSGASAYLAALVQGAQVFEACSCAEDADSLLR